MSDFSEWVKPCRHGLTGRHNEWLPEFDETGWCLGGTPVTMGDVLDAARAILLPEKEPNNV